MRRMLLALSLLLPFGAPAVAVPAQAADGTAGAATPRQVQRYGAQVQHLQRQVERQEAQSHQAQRQLTAKDAEIEALRRQLEALKARDAASAGTGGK